MDFVTHLPSSKGRSVVLVVVDRLSKYAHFCPMSGGFTAVSVARVFVKDICRLHGVPGSIVSDRDPVFINTFWKEFFRLQGITLAHSSSYHPQSDGQTEVLNRILDDYLRCYVSENQLAWLEWLPWAEYHYNTVIHSGLKCSPFELVYGRPPSRLVEYEPGSTVVASVDEMLAARAKMLAQARLNLARAQLRMTQQANKHRTDVNFEVGNWVFVKLRPHRQTSIRGRSSPKLAKRYYGPFRVRERIGKVAYKLDLPANSKIHNVFHVSILKRCTATPPFQQVDWPVDFVNDQPILLPESILRSRVLIRNGQQIKQVLVEWKGQEDSEATWEDFNNFKDEFPQWNHEDVVAPHEGGTDATRSQVQEQNKRKSSRQRIPAKTYPPDRYVTKLHTANR